MTESDDAATLAMFAGVVERHQRALFQFLRGLVSDPELARDLTQDVFAEAWPRARQGQPPFVAKSDPAEARRWLWRVAYCRAIDARRRARIVPMDSLEAREALGAIPATASFEEQVANHADVQTALRGLAPIDAACLILVIVQGFTTQEAAHILGDSPQAIARRFTRAKQRLLAAYLAPSSPKGARP